MTVCAVGFCVRPTNFVCGGLSFLIVFESSSCRVLLAVFLLYYCLLLSNACMFKNCIKRLGFIACSLSNQIVWTSSSWRPCRSIYLDSEYPHLIMRCSCRGFAWWWWCALCKVETIMCICRATWWYWPEASQRIVHTYLCVAWALWYIRACRCHACTIVLLCSLCVNTVIVSSHEQQLLIASFQRIRFAIVCSGARALVVVRVSWSCSIIDLFSVSAIHTETFKHIWCASSDDLLPCVISLHASRYSYLDTLKAYTFAIIVSVVWTWLISCVQIFHSLQTMLQRVIQQQATLSNKARMSRPYHVDGLDGARQQLSRPEALLFAGQKFAANRNGAVIVMSQVSVSVRFWECVCTFYCSSNSY